MSITAKQIIELLADRHSTDVFVRECKNGPTQSVSRGQLVKLDAWAMKSSWSNPCTFGYEVKISRSDFLGDDKWQRYLTYCNEFYFVAPSGVIEKNELPEHVGLISVSKNGSKLFTKKKAPRREVEIQENLWRYVLMCRSEIKSESTVGIGNNLEFWKSWLAEKTESRSIGRSVSRSLRKQVDEQVRKVKEENKQMKDQIAALTTIKNFADNLGIPINKYVSQDAIDQKHRDRQQKVPLSIIRRVLTDSAHTLHRQKLAIDDLLIKLDDRTEQFGCT